MTEIKEHTPLRLSPFRAVLFLFAALSLIYGNSLDCSWHFDDFKNILENANVRLESFTWEGIRRALAGLPGEGMQRPFAYLTFALNYMVGRWDVKGYHLVNVFIHFIASLFLYLFIKGTLHLPLLREKYGGRSHDIALLAVFLWSLHPIQVYAVTYIVQRMAGMAAMFYMAAMYFYLRARTAEKKGRKTGFFFLTALSASFALATKENAATLPVVLFLYDLLLIRGVAGERVQQYLKWSPVPLLLIVAAGWYYLDPAKLLAGYETRPFTLGERLLTQPRVLIFYVSLLLYPLSSRFTLLHDMEVSRSLLTPWTTLPAMIIVLSLPVAALYYARKKPLYSFCILFFFINHFIEGSFIPLEMIFEHRNYLPSMLFFLPPAALAVRCLEQYAKRRAVMLALVALIVSFITVEGVAVTIQNSTLKNDLTMWLDNREKSPGLHRPHHNLAKTYLALGMFPQAFEEFQLALRARTMSSTFQKYETYYYLGQCYRLMGDDAQALKQFAASIRLVSFFPDVYQGRAEVMLARGQYGAAERDIRRALSLDAASPSFHLTYSEILLKLGRPDAALGEARKALMLRDDLGGRVYGLMAEIFSAKKDRSRAAHFRLLARKWERAKP